MKRRSFEEELKILITRFDAILQIITPKQAAPILKQLDVLQKRTKPKRSVKGSQVKNQNSGLLKPVAISQDIAKFANWNIDELHSRVDVTKTICDYIKTHNLQKSSNKKNILPDDVLKSLLNWDEDRQKITISVTSVDLTAEADQITFVIELQPLDGLQGLNYYNGSELYTQADEFVAVLKNMRTIEQDDTVSQTSTQYVVNLEKRQEKVELSSVLVIKVPLTYPKIQSRISIHLAETEKPPKKIRVKKTPEDVQKKKNKKSAINSEEPKNTQVEPCV